MFYNWCLLKCKSIKFALKDNYKFGSERLGVIDVGTDYLISFITVQQYTLGFEKRFNIQGVTAKIIHIFQICIVPLFHVVTASINSCTKAHFCDSQV